MSIADRRHRRRALLIGGLAWIALGVFLLVVVGGATGFIPDDPIVPQMGFVDAGGGRVAVEIGPRAFAAAEGIEVRSGNQARNGRMLWQAKRTARSTDGVATDATDGRVVIGEVPTGFEQVDALVGALPKLWHVEVDNRCYFGSSVAPDTLTTDLVTLSSGERVTAAGFRANDRGFTSCDTNSLGGRLAAFAGVVSIALGGVLLIALWWDLRRGLPPELGGDEPTSET